MKKGMKITWLIVFIITSIISWLLAINQYTWWLYTRIINGDAINLSFSYPKLIIFIIVNLIISYLISFLITSLLKKKN